MKEKLIGKKYLPHRTVIGFVLGIIAGLLFKDFSVWVLPFGTAFMNLIKMLIVPVIFFSLVSGISAIGDVNRLKRVGMKIVATYVVMTAVSCFIGIAVVSITHPGAGFDTSVLTAYDPSNLTTPSFGGFLLGMIPTNIVSSMANQDIMQMVFFTMILAIALVIVGEKAKVVTEFMNQSANVIYSVASISREVRDHVITVNGFSKSYAMTGWRIGYAAARADIIKGIMKVQSQTTSATSAISQKAAVAALQGPQYDLHDMVKEFARRKEYMVKRLNAVPGIVCPDAMGAFYLYPDVQEYLGKSVGERKIENAMDLCQYLLDEALVSTVPGEAYNVAGKIRISYSNSMKNLEEGMDRIEKALAALQ